MHDTATPQLSRRHMLRFISLGLASTFIPGRHTSAQPARLRFGVGPLQPTPGETKTAFEPFFKYLAQQLGTAYDLVATTDWAGISVALANEQVDLAWMGPWGYVLANADSGVQAIATAKYDGKPIYHAIIVGRPDLDIKTWPDDAKGQTDLATDFDRNRTAMIEGGRLDPKATKIIWTSDPLPNDALAVRKGFDAALAKEIQTILVGISEEQAKQILPNHYTGFVAASHANYKMIEDAGIAVGRLKPK
jgi:phosphonate transport system substrate-binding protein